jgi:hypothetical protein
LSSARLHRGIAAPCIGVGQNIGKYWKRYAHWTHFFIALLLGQLVLPLEPQSSEWIRTSFEQSLQEFHTILPEERVQLPSEIFILGFWGSGVLGFW